MKEDTVRLNPSPSPNIIVMNDMVTPRPATVPVTYPMNQRGKEIHLDSENRPTFTNIRDDIHFLDNLNRYAKVCDQLNVPITQMANSLARAIGIQNKGLFNVLVYDYLLAIPQYPLGGGTTLKWGNMVCYKNKLFGVAVFPANEHTVVYFPELSTYNREVQELIFSYGNKKLFYSPERHALAFDFIPTMSVVQQQTLQPLLLTATLQRKLSEGMEGTQNVRIIKVESDTSMNSPTSGGQEPKAEYIQLE